MWQIPKLLVVAYEKNFLPKFLLFKIKYAIDGVVYKIIDTYYYFIIPIREWTYRFVCE